MYEVKRGNRFIAKIVARRGWTKADALAEARTRYGGGVNVTKVI